MTRYALLGIQADEQAVRGNLLLAVGKAGRIIEIPLDREQLLRLSNEAIRAARTHDSPRYPEIDA